MPPMHRKDLDKLAAAATEHGWEVLDTDPFTATKLGRTIRVTVNLAGMISAAEWTGGAEKTKLGSGTASVGRLLGWFATPIDEPEPETDFEKQPWLPETDLQAETPPPPVIPDALKESVGEVPAGTPMIPPPVVEEPAVGDAPPDPLDPLPDPNPQPVKKTPAKKAPVKVAGKEKDAPNPEAGGAVPPAAEPALSGLQPSGE